MRERQHIYVHHIGSLAPGALAQDVPMPTDSDAPFALRGRSIRVKQSDTIARTAITNLATRWRNARGDYAQQELIPVPVDMPFGCAGGCVSPVYPNEVYAANQPIHADVINNSATLTLDVTLYYHGVKLFEDDGPAYPAKCSLLAFDYSLPRLRLPNVTPLILSVGQTLRDVVFTIESDAWYALRAGQVAFLGGVESRTYSLWRNLLVTMYDWQKKAYMSAPVEIEHVFGRMGAIALAGPWNPGLIVPEILLPPYGYLFFDFVRDDAALQDTSDTSLQLVFQGMKVFPK